MKRCPVLPALALLVSCSSAGPIEADAVTSASQTVSIRLSRPTSACAKSGKSDQLQIDNVDTGRDFVAIILRKGLVPCPSDGELIYSNSANIECGDFRVRSVGNQAYGSGDAELLSVKKKGRATILYDFDGNPDTQYLAYSDLKETSQECNVALILKVSDVVIQGAKDIEVNRGTGGSGVWAPASTTSGLSDWLNGLQVVSGRIEADQVPGCVKDDPETFPGYTVFFAMGDIATQKMIQCTGTME